MEQNSLLWLIPLAFCLDMIIGDPVYRFHPIRIIGNGIIIPMETLFRRIGFDGYFAGFALTALTVGIASGIIWWINHLLRPYTFILLAFNLYILYSCIAIKDLTEHVTRVEKALQAKDIVLARHFLAQVVGRETTHLSEQDIARACVETLAENLSDGIVAPLFYAFIGGAPLAMFYKAANTLDSMVGYKNERYARFGFCSARLDDLLNWIPARLSMGLILMSGIGHSASMHQACQIALSDRKQHSSPNSGHPEAALAGIMNIRLGGTGTYSGQIVKKPFINSAGNPVSLNHISVAENIVLRSAVLSLLLLSVLHWTVLQILS